MPDVLVLRFDAPLMSFGGVRVDERGPTFDFPTLSMIAGLLGNAMGYDRLEATLLERLQRRIRYAVRCDRPGVVLNDFQTVDITERQPFMSDPGWTTRGEPEGRRGGAETRGNLHIRRREFWADAVYTVALTLDPADEAPALDRVEAALREPERPIFLGRKPCIPAVPLVVERSPAGSLLAALESAPRVAPHRARAGKLRAWVPEGETGGPACRPVVITDQRDWANQIVVGRRVIFETFVDPPEASDAR